MHYILTYLLVISTPSSTCSGLELLLLCNARLDGIPPALSVVGHSWCEAKLLKVDLDDVTPSI